MTRRDFVIALNSMVITTPLFIGNTKDIQLQANCAHSVAPNTKLFLPKNPKKGQFVHLVVPPKSAVNPSELVFEDCLILDDSENLTLDTFGIFKISFEGSKKGWTLLS